MALAFFSTAYTRTILRASVAAFNVAVTKGPRPAPTTITTLYTSSTCKILSSVCNTYLCTCAHTHTHMHTHMQTHTHTHTHTNTFTYVVFVADSSAGTRSSKASQIACIN